MGQQRSGLRAQLVLIALLVSAICGLISLRSCGLGPELSATSIPTSPSPAPDEPTQPVAAPAPPVKRADRSAKCESGAGQLCYRGDVWSLDSCDALEEKIDECDVRSCVDGACASAPTNPCREPEQGRCAGDVVRVCVAGRVQSVDCSARSMSCVMGSEGAECVAAIPREQGCATPDRCEGSRLIRCEAGRKVEVDCERERARCLTLPDTHGPQCVKLSLSKVDEACGPCGCPPDPRRREQRCDGVDEDGDRLLDEGLDCGALPVVAFIVTDASGNSSHAPEDVDLELQRLNRALQDEASETTALSFVLDELIWLREPELLVLDERELGSLADDSRVHPARQQAYLPLIFTDTVTTDGGVPRPGVSTLPNGTCGGLQEHAGPQQGIVAVSKARSTTTVIHEVGHFLGLCHTHEQRLQSAISGVADGAAIKACDLACRVEGDGICDTALDPGPESCVYDESCATACRDGERPDANNLMSYYTSCRSQFSAEQIAMMQHSLALRRAWYPCTIGACRCEPGGDGCPMGMSCRPHVYEGQNTYLCSLNGPHSSGADCRSPADCGAESVCLTESNSGLSRCARLCVVSSPDCDCVSAGDALQICREDVAP